LRAPDITDLFLINVAEIKSISDRLGEPVQAVLAFWGELDSQPSSDHATEPPKRHPSQYDRIFQNKAKLSSDNLQKLALPFPAGVTLADVFLPGCAALGITAEDYRLLTGAGANGWSLTSAAVPAGATLLRALSILLGWKIMAGAVGLPIRDLLRLRAIVGIDPCSSPDAAARFLDAAESVRNAGWTIDDLDFLLRHVAVPDRLRRFTDDTSNLVQRAMDSASQGINTWDRGVVCAAMEFLLDHAFPVIAGTHSDQTSAIWELLEGTGGYVPPAPAVVSRSGSVTEPL